MYKEFEVDSIGHAGELASIRVNRDNVSYYRLYSLGDDNKDMSMLYLKGSVKGLKINCSREELQRKIKEAE